MRLTPLLLLGVALIPSAATANERDEREIRAAIEAGARACEAGRPEEVMRAYAPDISLSYPGTIDHDYAMIQAGYRQVCAGGGEGSVESTRATFQEVIVSGGLAVVRLTWTTRLRGMPEGRFRRLQDMQVWRRTPEGWRFFRGVHYPLQL